MLYFWNLARGIIEAQPQVKCISGEKKTLFSTRLRLLLYQCFIRLVQGLALIKVNFGGNQAELMKGALLWVGTLLQDCKR